MKIGKFFRIKCLLLFVIVFGLSVEISMSVRVLFNNEGVSFAGGVQWHITIFGQSRATVRPKLKVRGGGGRGTVPARQGSFCGSKSEYVLALLAHDLTKMTLTTKLGARNRGGVGIAMGPDYAIGGGGLVE